MFISVVCSNNFLHFLFLIYLIIFLPILPPNYGILLKIALICIILERVSF
jgi:hypothetical protein